MTPSDTAVLLTPVWPARGGNGLAMRAGLLAEGLARNHRVHVVVAPLFGSAPRDDLLGALGCSVTVLDLASPAGAAREVAEIAQDASLVWAFRLYLAPLLDFLLADRAGGRALAIDVDDLDAVVQRQLGDEDAAAASDRLERNYLPRVDLVTAASAGDAADLARRHGLAKAAWLPNAVRPPAVAEDGPSDFDLVFVANLSYAPNAEAACWLARELRPQLTALRIAVVGSSPTDEVRALNQLEGVTIAADVADLGGYYARSAVAVAPLAAGGGTRIKVIEALAYGRPVVATPLGAEGIALDHGDGLVIAERTEFAAACRELLADPGRSRAIGLAGRDIVTRTLSVDVISARVDDLARDILAP